MCQRILSIVILFAILFQFSSPSVYAQGGCALQINEVMYHPAPGTDAAARAEWVELYVAQEITADTSFFITDLDAPSVGVFDKPFVVPAGTAVGTYILINNDGDPANDGQTTPTGIYTTISFFMGNAATKLVNDGDEVVLYVGSATDGVPCDYVQWEGGEDGPPAGFSWGGGCEPDSNGDGLSVSLDPNGIASNSGCDWATSGENSPNNPDLPITGAPHTKGWSNNTTPTAVTLASFDVSSKSTLFNGLSTGVVGLLGAIAIWQRRRK